MRPFYFTLGWVFFGVGFAGAFVPVLPTTPFMLLALWSFSRSSPRFHSWLYNHKFFGPPLQQWHEHHVIPPIAKLFALFFMTTALLYLYLFSAVALWIKLLASVIVAYGAWFILGKPSYPPGQQLTDKNNSEGHKK